jgi:hypothetical protein
MALPQVAEANIPQSMDAAGEYLLYDECMTRVYVVGVFIGKCGD